MISVWLIVFLLCAGFVSTLYTVHERLWEKHWILIMVVFVLSILGTLYKLDRQECVDVDYKINDNWELESNYPTITLPNF